MDTNVDSANESKEMIIMDLDNNLENQNFIHLTKSNPG